MSGKCWMGIGIVAALATSMVTAGCSATLGEETELEHLGQTTEALLGANCSNLSSTMCWYSWSGPNYDSFDVRNRFMCAVSALDRRTTDCFDRNGSSLRLGWGNSPSYSPDETKSTAIYSPFERESAVLLLGDDNVVRAAFGDMTATMYSGTNFKYIYEYIKPKDKSGNAVCLNKIASVHLPGVLAPNLQIIGLGCDGKLYTKALNSSNEWCWTLAAQFEPWSLLPSATRWKDISHSGTNWGAFLLSSDSKVTRVGHGTADNRGRVVYSTPVVLPALPKLGSQNVKPIAVGGPFVITDAGDGTCTQQAGCSGDDQRFYRYYEDTGAWVASGTGVASFPASQAQANAGPPYKRIVDGTSFHGRRWEFFVWNHFSRVNSWTSM